jgi:hypothetical protein
LNSNSSVQFLDFNTPLIPMPVLAGSTSSIKYNLGDGKGSAHLSGGVYAGIKIVTAAVFPTGYFVAEGDSTVLANGVPVNVFDPSFSALKVNPLGKILFLKNIGTTAIMVTFQNGSGATGDFSIPAGAASMIQSAADLKWYRILGV